MSQGRAASKQNIKEAIYENNLRFKQWILSLFSNRNYLAKIGEQNGAMTYNNVPIGASGALYADCFTEAEEQDKVILLNNFTLISGVTVIVKFVNGNSTTRARLKINDEDAKDIIYRDSNTITGLLLEKGSYLLRYNGAAFVLIGNLGSANDSGSSGGYTEEQMKQLVKQAIQEMIETGEINPGSSGSGGTGTDDTEVQYGFYTKDNKLFMTKDNKPFTTKHD